MGNEKKNDMKLAGKEAAVDYGLEVSSDIGAEIMKESITSTVLDIGIDSISSMIPGVSGGIQSYKRLKLERNIHKFIEELHKKTEKIRLNFESKTVEQQKQIDQLFYLIMEFVIEEPQEEKIEFMVNGFEKITEHEQITNDFVLLYYDVLSELRMVDISVLKFMYDNRFVFNEEPKETYIDIMQKHGLTTEQYTSVRSNLLRIGLLSTNIDVNVEKDLKAIEATIKSFSTYLERLTDAKRSRSLPKLAKFKLKSKDRLEFSKFGIEFVRFFINEHSNN